LEEVFAEYDVRAGGVDDFLAIVLERIEAEYGLTGFADDFTDDFEAFLQAVDTDPDTEGLQPYLDPTGTAILTLADTGWFGPAQTWPAELANHPWIHFWHRLDEALAGEDIPALLPQGLNDEAWLALFDSGPLAENPDIAVSIWADTRLQVFLRETDQIGAARPANAQADIGAIERP
jgi:hypothetical protein